MIRKNFCFGLSLSALAFRWANVRIFTISIVYIIIAKIGLFVNRFGIMFWMKWRHGRAVRQSEWVLSRRFGRDSDPKFWTLVWWPSSQAELCKSFYSGANPLQTSKILASEQNLLHRFNSGWRLQNKICQRAGTGIQDRLKIDCPYGIEGSTPSAGTKLTTDFYKNKIYILN